MKHIHAKWLTRSHYITHDCLWVACTRYVTFYWYLFNPPTVDVIVDQLKLPEDHFPKAHLSSQRCSKIAQTNHYYPCSSILPNTPCTVKHGSGINPRGLNTEQWLFAKASPSKHVLMHIRYKQNVLHAHVHVNAKARINAKAMVIKFTVFRHWGASQACGREGSVFFIIGMRFSWISLTA